ncbi:c-type cytochrome [Paremcibacter congregatus]|uniref:c-type cytochrome n=1 Tax=Paremcibacter congregatus TaxID=2043170 RepID=UPI003A9303FB
MGHYRMISILALAVFLPGGAAAENKRGHELYHAYCSQCHGVNGDGFGVNAGYMDVLPKDHTETKEMESRSDDDLFKAIKSGGAAVNKSVLMPAWGNNIADEDIRALVVYLRELSKPVE